MPTYTIRGINVDFPYKAYDCQLVYMEKVIQSLQDKRNALLESPTGTGKTLCLLCATLAWRKSLGEFSRGRTEKSNIRESQDSDDELSQSQSSSVPKIIYTSRTHSQIKQVIQELKRCKYRPKMAVLGSREQLCIHEQVSLLHGKTQTHACHALCKKRTKRFCSHFSRVKEFVVKNPGIGDDPIDIEDLVNVGRSCGPCPYFLSREIHRDADILFAPYNYLIDRGNRKSLKINWNNSILIFDEAHNLEALCADAASFDLPSSLLTACISEAKNCVDLSIARREVSSDKSCNPDNFAILKALLLKLEKTIAEVSIESKELGFTRDGPYIYELLAQLNITQSTANMLMGIIEKACALLEEDANGSDSTRSNKTNATVCRLETMGDILRLIFKDNGNAHAQYYRLHVQEVEGKTSRTLSWWCFNPGIAMEEFTSLGVGSIILTSGTLSPMDSFADELKLEFPIRLENPHVISENQIWAGVASVGPSGYSFNSSYRTRGTAEYKQELGNAIVNFARIVPDGLLVFFPSYYVLDQCISSWKDVGPNLTNSTTIWERICKHKLPVVEPRQSSLFPMAIEDYMTKLKEPTASGAIFFAVCRGKVSEGLDFADHAGRAVVITGLPFATMIDPKVRLKREYLDQHLHSQKTGNKGLTGEDWYSQQASRAVNQAVGRVIRHQHDYGAIIFCDERFAHSNRKSQISLWIQPHVKCYSKFGDVVYTLTRFFRDGGTRGPTKLELEKKADQENPNDSQSFALSEKLPVPEMSVVDPSFSLGLISTRQSKQGNISSNLKEIVPANRSFLKPENGFRNTILKCSGYLTNTGKEPSISEKKNIKDSDAEMGDLVETSLMKKRRMLITGPSQSKQQEMTDHPLKRVKIENSQCSENAGSQNPLGQEDLRVNNNMVTHRSTINLSIPKQKNVVHQTAVHRNEETKGSAFLNQVRQKLSDAEYKEFVGFMKALKSKTMKIGHVLESIAALFSAPDRHSLLHGFKDYVPAKYHELYEYYLCATSKAVDV
ncbi:regulator of telomere elongation helicase 1 homolog isoform X2 [Andrographis paniculata]|uniref:regulator of telomere elongation helicase 1 homolog isoform X2 n=1 Tax=Andrographis paniculata TaxID=175694 RepID=UPI0021E7AFBB|nr:regulator of telomere elongation helicase 1 homolog isoform X2 [Andrographis paniculata]